MRPFRYVPGTGFLHRLNPSIKLLAVCQEQCATSFLIETQDEINPEDLKGAKRVGVTAGASTPNWLIDQVIKRLKDLGNSNGNGARQ